MGKLKRKDDYDHIMKKLRKLEDKLKRSRSVSNSSIEEGIDVVNTMPVRMETCEENSTILSTIHSDANEINLNEEKQEPELDPEILELLGSDPSNQTKFGENLHKDVMSRWSHILTNGLEKEVKTELLKAYLPPENCQNLKAPKLNAEIKAALNEVNQKKEMFNENKQNQLASCLAALVKSLNLAIDKQFQEIIKPLSDAGRLLCDYHFRESQSRRYSIINTLNKDIRETVRNTKIDDFLFGSDLADQLKSAKAINKSSTELRIPPKPPQKPAPQRGALNSRGARGVASATRQYPRRPAASAATTSRDRDRDRDHHRQSSHSNRSSSYRGRTKRY